MLKNEHITISLFKLLRHHNKSRHLKTQMALLHTCAHSRSTPNAPASRNSHQYVPKDTHKCTVQAGKKSEEMLMPTNTLRRGCTALKWSLLHTKANHRSLAGPIKLFSKCCRTEIACLVNPICYGEK